MREKLEREISQRQAQLSDLNARERDKERKRDTRRKIIVGALAMQHRAIDGDFNAVLSKLINEHVASPTDRALFDLPPIQKREAN